MEQMGHCTSRELYFFLWKRKPKPSIGNRIFCTPRIVPALKRVEFISHVIYSSERSLV